MSKRIIAMLTVLTVVLSFGSGIIPVSAAEERTLSTEENVAEVYLGNEVLSKGYKEVGVGQTNKPLVAEKGGESCWELPTNNWQNCYIFCNLDDNMKSEQFDGSAYTIEVDYFDTGNGFFKISYRDCHGEMQTPAIIYTSGERMWKTATVTIYDALFEENAYDPSVVNLNNTRSDYQRPGDFIIQSRTRSNQPWSREAISIKRIKVTRETKAYPVYSKAWNERAGSIYKWYEESKILYNDVENLTDEKQTVKLTHNLVGKRGHKSLTKTENIELAPREKKTLELDFGPIDYCDLYEYTVGIELADGNSYSRKLTEIAILKTDPDGIKNDNVYYTGHAERYTEELSEQFFEVLSLSNSGGYRGEFQWQALIDSSGAFTKVDSNNYSRSVKQLTKYGLGFIPLLNCPPTGANFRSWSDYPVTDVQLELWRGFIAAAATYLKDVTDTYELLNEPNIAGFNYDRENFWGEEYATLAKVTKDEIVKHDPDAKVGGPSLTGIRVKNMDKNTQSSAFYEEAMKAGMGEGIDAIVLHPYYYGEGAASFEESTRVSDIQWYKDMYKDYTGKEAEVWHTESGISAYDVKDRSVITKGYLDSRFILTAKTYDVSTITSLYNLEKKGELANNREDLFGHVSSGYPDIKKWDKNYFPTESYLMITGLNYVMAQSEADGVYDPEAQPNIRLNKYKSDKFGADIAAFWTIGDVENLTLNLGCSSITLYDAYGNAKEMQSEDGIYSFVATAEPRYIVGNFTAIERLETNKFEWSKYEQTAAYNDILTLDVKLNGENKGYRISAELPEGTSLAGESGFDENGNGSIQIENTLPTGTSFLAEVNITDESGNRVHSIDIPVESVRPISLDLSLKIADGGDVNRWIATAKLSNHSSTRAAKGHIELNSPAAVSKVKNIDVGIVPKNATGEVSFGLPKIVRKGEYIFEYDFVSEDGERYSFETPIDLTVAPYAHTKPTIDGVLGANEWVYDASMFADYATQIKQITGWGGASDLSGRSAVMWDEENMYMYAEVTDDVFFNNQPLSTHWNGDSMQVGVFYGDEGFITMGQSGTTFHEFGLARSSSEGAGAYRTLSQNNSYPKGLIENAEVEVINKGAKTVYEVKIPWKSLLNEGHQPKEGDMLGFSFLINDNDGTGRRGWIEYASGIGENKNIELFTYLTLIK